MSQSEIFKHINFSFHDYCLHISLDNGNEIKHQRLINLMQLTTYDQLFREESIKYGDRTKCLKKEQEFFLIMYLQHKKDSMSFQRIFRYGGIDDNIFLLNYVTQNTQKVSFVFERLYFYQSIFFNYIVRCISNRILKKCLSQQV